MGIPLRLSTPTRFAYWLTGPKATPPHRVFAPDTEVLGRTALLSGILCRLQGYEKDGKLRSLQDCVLFLQAQKLSPVVLTACSNSSQEGARCFTARDEGAAEPNSIWRRPSMADRDGLNGACRCHSDWGCQRLLGRSSLLLNGESKLSENLNRP